MKDYAIIATAYNSFVRIYGSVTTNLVNEARIIHDTWPTATAALGRFLTASAMMGLMYKGDEKLTLQIKGDGPINTMLVEATSKGTVRADIINPHVYIRHEIKGKLDVGAAVGNGFLNVTKDLNMKNIFTSSIELTSGEIAEDFANYFLKSEQTASAVSLGVLVENNKTVRASGGFIVQLLPGANEQVISSLEKRINEVGPVSRWFDENKSLEDLMKALSDDTYKELQRNDLKYECNCSKERFAKSLSALDNKTMDGLIADNGIEVECHFCKTKYKFSKDDLMAIKVTQKS